MPSTIKIVAGSDEAWEALESAIRWLGKWYLARAVSTLTVPQGIKLTMRQEDAEELHTLLAYFKLPLTIEIEVGPDGLV